MIWFWWLLSEAVEQSLFSFNIIWQLRKELLAIVILAASFVSVLLVINVGNMGGPGLAAIAVFRIINLLRVAKARMNEPHLRRVASQTSWWLAVMQIILAGLIILGRRIGFEANLIILAILNLLFAISLVLTIIYSTKKLPFRSPAKFLADSELPTVSVAIPARNESRDLEDCLRTVLNNDYPKLEVLVYDDESFDKTAEIIKSFAHDGVRFVKNPQTYDERWLPKNAAYQKLLAEASGEWLLFIGVDVRLGPRAIRAAVNYAVLHQKKMISVLPRRGKLYNSLNLIQPMRYWWELALPRKLLNRPAVLSTFWLIAADEIKQHGGFAAVSSTILPERYFARELVKSDAYSFISSADDLAVEIVKSTADQVNTVIRVRYPQIHRRPELVLLVLAIELIGLLGPFIFLVLFSADHRYFLAGLEAASVLSLIVAHLLIIKMTDPKNFGWGLVNFPLVIVSELFYGLKSMLNYEFFEVTWKERSITNPIMHTIAQLPSK